MLETTSETREREVVLDGVPRWYQSNSCLSFSQNTRRMGTCSFYLDPSDRILVYHWARLRSGNSGRGQPKWESSSFYSKINKSALSSNVLLCVNLFSLTPHFSSWVHYPLEAKMTYFLLLNFLCSISKSYHPALRDYNFWCSIEYNAFYSHHFWKKRIYLLFLEGSKIIKTSLKNLWLFLENWLCLWWTEASH